jgi:Uma2 family endonuclease
MLDGRKEVYLMQRLSRDLITLEHFLRLPEFKPAFEYLGGRVIQKMSAGLRHSMIQGELFSTLNTFARPRKLGRAYIELRAVFGGAAQVPDVSFFVTDRIPKFIRGEEIPLLSTPPDIVVEILSPGQTIGELRIKLRHSLKHGSKLGWLIHPTREEIRVLRPRQKAELLKAGDVLSGEGVLPGFSLPVEEIFGWLDQD